MICRILPHQVADGPSNMACDDVLLSRVDANPGEAVFRTYSWAEPTLSLGYFQSTESLESSSSFLGCPVVRRITGGGAIWHEQDLTYALVLPRAIFPHTESLYWLVHGMIAACLEETGLAVGASRAIEQRQTLPDSDRSRVRPFLCFEDHGAFDVVLQGRKLVGSAQRRKPRAVLIHGSVQLTQTGAERAEANVMVRSHLVRIPAVFGLELVASEFRDTDLHETATLAESRYRSDAWTHRR
jgi:lipoate-protein ligase A